MEEKEIDNADIINGFNEQEFDIKYISIAAAIYFLMMVLSIFLYKQS